jgi:hypothetical protein
VLRLIGRQPRELHLPAGIVAEASVEVPAPESPRVAIRRGSQTRPSPISRAARSATNLSLRMGSPRSSLSFCFRWPFTHCPSGRPARGSSAQLPGTLQSPCAALYATSRAKCASQPLMACAADDVDSTPNYPRWQLKVARNLECLGSAGPPRDNLHTNCTVLIFTTRVVHHTTLPPGHETSHDG